ncbi:MAG: nitroreductase family protein [Flavobacteriales bacterium]|nr:nitroreductase family protein [Flavobacteriales bacterium]
MRHSISDITETIRDRRTIQPTDYTDREVQRDVIDKVLGNAIWAPTHGMTQPWRFSVFTGKGRERLSAFMGAEYMRLFPGEKFMQRKYDSHVQRPLQSSVVVALGLARDPNGKIPCTRSSIPWPARCRTCTSPAPHTALARSGAPVPCSPGRACATSWNSARRTIA